MNKRIMVSGPDGTGKSTIISAVAEKIKKDEGIQVKVKWVRFNHYLAKLVNAIGRLTGKSYVEQYSWGRLGYHDYSGVFGSLYIFVSFLDHILFILFVRRYIFKVGDNESLILDRYIFDKAADLMVDTGNKKLVLAFFSPFIKDEVSRFTTYILLCDQDTAINRRPDISDDKKYQDKIAAYHYLADKFCIEIINTGEKSIEDSAKKILE